MSAVWLASAGALQQTPAPLAVRLDPRPGESLIGMVARATRLNVLGRTSVILDACGLRFLHPGALGQEIDDCASLATHLGCSLNDVKQRLHGYMLGDAGRSDIQWGSGALLRTDLVLENRRVSPASIVLSDHHRASWMNRLLPYCPESLELLIDTCQVCGKQQGWRHAWGIGVCDEYRCRATLTTKSDDKVPNEIADGYRLFARIASSEPVERASALATLHPRLASLPGAVLINLALQLGATMQNEKVKFHRSTVRRWPAAAIAVVAARGADLLSEWPTKMRSNIADELLRCETAIASRAFLQSVRRLALARPMRPEQAEAVRHAVPEAFEHVSVALASLVRPVVGANTVCRLLNFSSQELRAVRKANLIAHRVIAGGKRIQVQFDEAEVCDLANRYKASIFASRMEQQFGLPRYAVEQLVCMGAIEREAHPALALVHPTLRLTKRSVAEFADRLEQAAHKGPADCLLPLGTAMRVMGGRPKPWAAVLAAMQDGSLPFVLQGSGKFIRRAFVALEDIKSFEHVRFDESNWPKFAFKCTLTQIDASEILNIDTLQLRQVSDTGALTFEPSGVAFTIAREKVFQMAVGHIATSEIALRTGMHFNHVPRFMLRYPSVTRLAAGWDRKQFMEAFHSA